MISKKTTIENLKISIGYDESVLDTNAFKRDIDEFLSYSELLARLHDFNAAFKQETEKRSTQLSNVELVKYFLNRLASEDRSISLSAAKNLAYFALGEYSIDNNQKDEQSLASHIMSNNRILFDSGTLDALIDQLELAIISETSDKKMSADLCETLVTVAYLIVNSNGYRADMQDGKLAATFNARYITVLFKCIAKFPDLSQNVPLLMRKTFLLLNKMLLILFGSIEEAKNIKRNVAKVYGLKSAHEQQQMKVDLSDILDFYDDVKDKYAAFPAPDIPFSPVVVRGDNELTNAMGLLWAASQVELAYILHFPPKSKNDSCAVPDVSVKSGIDVVQYKKELEKVQSKTPFEHGVPTAIHEARELLASHLHLSPAQYQLCTERQRAAAKQESEQQQRHQQNIRLNDRTSEKLDLVETVYASVFDDLPQFVCASIKELLMVASEPVDKDGTALQDCEICRTAISSTLLLVLKWFKVSHVLKFEYFAQLLIDQGYLLLATRMLVLEDLKALRTRKTDSESDGFFSHVSMQSAELFNSVSSSSSLASTSSWVPSDFCSEDNVDYLQFVSTRNESWLMDTLRIMRMVSKGKKLRSKILAQYKFWIPAKRICNAMPDSTAERYALKLLKEQVSYLGLQWRSSHMKLVSAIARRCPPRLREEWLVCKDDEEQKQEERVSYSQEVGTRLLVQIYHGHRYQAGMLPTFDSDKAISLEDLQHNTHQQQQLEEEQKEEKEDGWPDLDGTVHEDDGWSVDTPIPCYQPPPSADALTAEINKLYREQIKKTNRDNNDSEPAVVDGWDAPVTFNPIVKRRPALTLSDEESDDDEDNNLRDNDDDPLQNIDWSTLTEEELMERMNKIKETTVQRWLNVDLDDPTHCKVLNAIEGLYVDSETGEGGVTPVYEQADENNAWV